MRKAEALNTIVEPRAGGTLTAYSRDLAGGWWAGEEKKPFYSSIP